MLALEILTPDKTILKEEVNQVTVPTTSGEITILPGHVALLSQIGVGELIAKKDKKEIFIALSSGYMEVTNDTVSILANYAVRSEEIEISKAEEAKKRAEKIMQEKVSGEDFALAQATFAKAVLELKVAQRRRRHTTPTP